MLAIPVDRGMHSAHGAGDRTVIQLLDEKKRPAHRHTDPSGSDPPLWFLYGCGYVTGIYCLISIACYPMGKTTLV